MSKKFKVIFILLITAGIQGLYGFEGLKPIPSDIEIIPLQRAVPTPYNWIRNGSFESASLDPINLTPDGWEVSEGLVSQTQEDNKDGIFSVYAPGFFSLSQVVENFNVLKGEKVALGAWVKSTEAGRVKVSLEDGVSDPEKASIWNSGLDEWEFVTVKIVVDPEATQLIVRIENDPPSSEGAYIDGVVLYQLTKDIAFTPNPSDDIKMPSNLIYTNLTTPSVGIGKIPEVGILDVAGDVHTQGKVYSQGTELLNQTSADELYVNVTGDTLDGNLTVGGTISAQSVVSSGIITSGDAEVLTTSGGIIRGDLGINGSLFFTTDPVTGQPIPYLTQTEADQNYVSLNGDDVINGDIYITGNVGIGTTAPTGNLHLANEAAGDLLILERTDTNYPAKWKLAVSASAQGDFAILDAMNDNVRRFLIDNQGHVGIGTSYPVDKLHIVKDEGPSAPYGLVIENHGADPGIQFRPTQDLATVYMTGTAEGQFSLEATDNINLRTNNANRLKIDSLGYVGIGTENPATILDVSGPLRFGAYTKATLPPAGVPGRLARVTDEVRGLWIDQGDKWHPLMGSVYPQWFGAVGDGEHDDTSAIKSALNASQSVELPCGTYIISEPLTIRSDQQIQGNGPCSRIKADGISLFKGGLLTIWGENKENKSRISIKNLALDGNRSKYEDSGIDAEINGIHLGGADHVIIDTVWIEDIPSVAAYGNDSSFGDGITISGKDNEYAIYHVTINDVIIRGFSRNGISLTNPSGVAISNFVIDNNGYSADPGVGIDIEPDGEASVKEIAISNGTITYTEYGIGLIAKETPGDGKPEPRNISLSNISVFETNHAAFNIHGLGISLSNCTTINTNKVGNTTGAIHITAITGGSAPLVRSETITITGCSIRNSYGHGISLDGVENVTLSGNTIDGSASSGVKILFDKNFSNENITISGNTITHNNESGVGIEPDSAESVLKHLTVVGNTIVNDPNQGKAIVDNATFSDKTTWIFSSNNLYPYP
ncbi:MAG: right-handed parallel beta-helix repeat-containing protein [Deltaproteobacteria bacterium]|nr:right-handed parallel beta-helix repeat-containing protein [Deltaproteobacteria bacterium]